MSLKSILFFAVAMILAIVAAHFVIKWLEGGIRITGNPRKEIGPQVNSDESATIDIESEVAPAT